MRSKTKKQQQRLFAIRCENEGGAILSSRIEGEAWDSIERLVELLGKREGTRATSSMSSMVHGSSIASDTLFSWRHEENHLAGAREAYAWRDAIDQIKACDLDEIASSYSKRARSNVSPSSREIELMKSKPIMLRLAGEITNTLLHSYNNRHEITFFQCDSTEPS